MSKKSRPETVEQVSPKRVRQKVAITKTAKTHGPISDLERHLPSNWWRHLFNSLYLKTDGDVVENNDNTTKEVDFVLDFAELDKEHFILDLCCGQGRHTLELARRGFQNLTGIDRSRYLIRLARKRSVAEKLTVNFHEGDARKFQVPNHLYDRVLMMGNSFGYFEHQQDDEAVLRRVSEVLSPNGSLVLDLVDGSWMKDNFEPRSWEWIDKFHFVCRERALAKDGKRIISREVITHSEKGVLADQFYAERLYTQDEVFELLERLGYRSVRAHGNFESDSTRNQDLGMMGRRQFFSAMAPIKKVVSPSIQKVKQVTVLTGAPDLPDSLKLAGSFGAEDLDTLERMKKALAELPGYKFKFFSNHQKLISSFCNEPPSFVLNFCDEGYMNNAFQELHVPAFMEMLKIPYSGSGPDCLGLCYNKGLVNAIASALDIPTPNESFIDQDDTGATIPYTFPAILKPNFGDGSRCITQHAVVNDASELLSHLDFIRNKLGPCSVLVQEFLQGTEYSVGIIGNPGQRYTMLPILEVDYSQLDANLPQILSYESKWDPQSPYWSQLRYKEAELDEDMKRQLHDYSARLFSRLGCRDYVRIDFRCRKDGQVQLLEVNPNPGWCWDGKMNMMAAWAGLSYSEYLGLILKAAEERLAFQE